MTQQYFREGLFSNKVAVVTGGGTGIGFATARKIAELGGTVWLLGRNADKLEAARNNITESGGHCFQEVCNIRNPEQVADCVKGILKRSERIDYLINNAGGQFPSPAERISSGGWNAVIETNLNGTFYVSQEVYKQAFAPQKSGNIVCVVANMWNGFPGMSHTGAARAGVVNLIKSLATEWGRRGVRVNGVAPGIIGTEALENYDPQTRKLIERAKGFNQLGRPGTPDEVADAIVFLMSPASSYITGECLKIDAGESIYSPYFPPSSHQKRDL